MERRGEDKRESGQTISASLREQFRAERMLNLVTENLPIILWMTNADRSDFYYNPRWAEFTGLGNRHITGEIWLGLLHPDDRDAVVESFEEAFSRRRPWSKEYRLRHRDGTYHWMLDMGEPCHMEDGRFAGFVGNSIDVTDLHVAMAEAQHANTVLEKRSQVTALIAQMNDDLQVCKTLAETSPLISLYMQRLFLGVPGAVFLINESRSLVELLVEWGGASIDPVFTREECWALRKGKLHLVEDRASGIFCKHVGTSAHASICVPMIAQGDVLGMTHLRIATGGAESGPALDTHRDLLVMMSDDLALNLSSIRSREALRHQSVRDPLTRLYNRRYMVESLERELARARRRKLSLAVVMMDVDHFKRYNDTHGHRAGDAVLAGIGKFLLTNLRAEDIACRYGGEELTLILPEIDAAAADARLNGIREKIAALQFEHLSSTLGGVTVSVGVALFPDHGDTAEGLLQLADAALYQAKKSGRNRVVIAGPDTRPQAD